MKTLVKPSRVIEEQKISGIEPNTSILRTVWAAVVIFFVMIGALLIFGPTRREDDEGFL